jgi:integral membrane protein
MIEIKQEQFRKLGIYEGISLLVLFFIAMPLKYGFDLPIAVRIVGSIHGALFTLYIFVGFFYAKRNHWNYGKLLFAYIVSTIPFGAFIFDKKLFPKK